MEGAKNCQLDDYWKGEIKEIRFLEKSRVCQGYESGADIDFTLPLDISCKSGLVLHCPGSVRHRPIR
jgi:hypothetical protein